MNHRIATHTNAPALHHAPESDRREGRLARLWSGPAGAARGPWPFVPMGPLPAGLPSRER
mgnify:FL=1